MNRLIFEHIIRTLVIEARTASLSTQAKKDLLNSKHASKFINLRASNRVGNKDNLTKDQFIEILQDVFAIEDQSSIKVKGPDQDPNPSSKFNAYLFPYKGGEAMLILAGKGKVESERQERGLINAVNSVSGAKTLVFKNKQLTGINSARKIPYNPDYKAEPYSDVGLAKSGGRELKISVKGLQAFSLGGGGITGVDTLNNPTLNKFIEAFYKEAGQEYQNQINSNPELKGKNLQGRSEIKDKYAKIPPKLMSNILKGTEVMGGPVDYYFVGDINAEPQIEGNTITFDGDLLTPKELAAQVGQFYVRLLKREGPCYFTLERNTKVNNLNIPKIFSKKPDGGGGTQSRIFITNKLTSGYYKE